MSQFLSILIYITNYILGKMKRVVFLADSISSQSAGIHYYGLQLIDGILKTFPNYEYHSISSSRIDVESIEQHIVAVNSSIPLHLRVRQLTSVPKLVNSLNPDIVIESVSYTHLTLPTILRV